MNKKERKKKGRESREEKEGREEERSEKEKEHPFCYLYCRGRRLLNDRSFPDVSFNHLGDVTRHHLFLSRLF